MPGSVVVAEEEAEGNPAVLDHLAGDGPVWIIDPLDGTANFAAGREDFAVIVAFAVAGRVRAGWLHHPLRNVTISAEQGGGAWAAGKRLRVAVAGAASEMTGSLGRRLRIKPEVAGRFADVIHLRSCGVEYMTLVEGGLHFAHYRRMKPWDHLAGALIHAEAGGHNGCLDGEPYRPSAPGEWGLLMAPDADSWERVAEILRPAVAEMM
jgi:fructose-1,6-bisphosphatase/inositol monophosphatase family enzyme